MSVDRDTRPFPDIRGLTGRSLADWGQEFAQVFRELTGRFAAHDAGYIRIDLQARSVSAYAVTGQKAELIGRAERSNPGEMAALARKMQERARTIESGNDVVVNFSQDLVFRLPLDLPKARTSMLRKAAFLELERLSPVPPASLYVDARFGPSDDSTRIRVELLAVRRSIVDDAVALCRDWRLSARAFRFEGDPREARPTDFPVDRPALIRSHWRKHGTMTLAALVLVLFVGLVLSVYARLAMEADSLIAQAEGESEKAIVVHHLERDIAAMRIQYDFAAAQKRAPLALAIMDELSATLPDNSWLTRVELKGDKVHVEGFSKSPSDVIAALDRSPYFANAQFGAPLEGAQEGAERFDLTFDVKGSARK